MEYNEYDNFSPYKKLLDALRNSYDGLKEGENTTFQFLSSPRDADWTTEMDYSLYELMDTVPAERGIYYVPGVSRVSTAFLDVLDSLQEGECQKNSRYMELRHRLNTCYDNLKSQLEPLKRTYMREEKISDKDFRSKPFIQWVRECAEDGSVPEAQKYIATLDKDYSSIEKQMESIKNKLASQYNRAKDAYDDHPVKFMDGSNNELVMPYCSLSGSIQKKVEDWQNQKEDEFALKTMMKEDRKKEGDWKNTYDTSFEASWFRGNAHAETEISRMIADVTYTVELKLKGINTFQINRGSWYNDTFVNPQMQFVEGNIFTREQFFGKNGTLQLIPTSVLVIYRPTIELTIDKEVYKERIYSRLGRSNTAAFFGMPFTISGGVDKHVVETPDDHVKLTFGPTTTERPRIIGVTSLKKYI